MRGLVVLCALVLCSMLLVSDVQASGGPGLAPLQARRQAGQNLRFSARQGRADFIRAGQVQPLRVQQVVVPGCVGAGCFQPLGVAPLMFQSRTIIVR